MDRRDALKKLAVGGAIAASAPAILSRAAFADSGTSSCFYSYTSPAKFTATLGTRRASGKANVSVTIGTAPSGSCQCGGAAPTITYAIAIKLTGTSTDYVSTGTGNPNPASWVASNTLTNNGPKLGSTVSYTISVGIRIDCAGIKRRAVICRFATATGSYTLSPTVNLGPTDLLLTSPPAYMPSC